MRTSLFVAVLLMAAAPAVAQPVRTTCQESNGRLDCETRPSSGDARYDPQRSFDQLQEARARALPPHDPAEDTRKEVGAAIAEGRCADAREIALRAGDFDLTDQVKHHCVTPRKGARR